MLGVCVHIDRQVSGRGKNVAGSLRRIIEFDPIDLFPPCDAFFVGGFRVAQSLDPREIGAALIKQGGEVDWFIVSTGRQGAFHYGMATGPGVAWPGPFESWLKQSGK